MFEYVYVNQDGTAREVSKKERGYLTEYFLPGDGGRPYVKSSYDALDGWGSLSGFVLRTKVPSSISILPVSPQYDSFPDEVIDDHEDNRKVGDIVTQNSDGSVTCMPNPKLPRKERFERLRQLHLERRRGRELLARHPAPPSP